MAREKVKAEKMFFSLRKCTCSSGLFPPFRPVKPFRCWEEKVCVCVSVHARPGTRFMTK